MDETAAALTGVPLRIGTIDLTFHHATSGVVQTVLSRAGYRLDLVTKPHNELFGMLDRGELDLLVSAWLPGSHGRYVAPFAGDLVELGALYEPYTLWGVPDYVPESEVREVADLARPSVAARMTKVIQGIGPGAGISRFSKEIIEYYRLGEQGYEFRNGTQAECEAVFENAVAQRRWVVVPLWQPQHLHQVHRIRELVEPEGLLRGRDTATLVIHRNAVSRVDQATLRVLRRMSLGNAAVTEMDYAINRLGHAPARAALEWTHTHPTEVRRWYT